MKNRYEIRGDVTAIFLHQKNGYVLETLIDTVDLKKAREFPNTWCALWANATQSYYCYGKLFLPNGKRVSVLLHRWITDCPCDMQIDHRDNDTLNNRRLHNLRVTTRSQNLQNRRGPQRNSTSGKRGIWWSRKSRKWQASIQVEGKSRHVGSFSSIEDADKAVKEARKQQMPFSKEAFL